jgi:hypothetical protein
MTTYKCIEDLQGNCIFAGKENACVFIVKYNDDIGLEESDIVDPTQCPYGNVEIYHHNSRLYPIIRQIRCEKMP